VKYGFQQTYLGDLSQSSSFLSEVDDNTAATVLCFFDSFLDTEDQVRAAGADIRSEYIATVALVVNSQRQSNRLVRHLCRVSETVHGETTNRWEEDFDVSTSDELEQVSLRILYMQGLTYLWVTSTSVFGQRTSKGGLIYAISVAIRNETKSLLCTYRCQIVLPHQADTRPKLWY
jgi:hypothetical protein